MPLTHLRNVIVAKLGMRLLRVFASGIKGPYGLVLLGAYLVIIASGVFFIGVIDGPNSIFKELWPSELELLHDDGSIKTYRLPEYQG